ncbi:MAG: HAD family hydrolase [Anaerolineales bacterium]|nr:HAD family hydrolase [Anaerolineales bacterium]
MLIHPIETVIFDLDGTLRHSIPSTTEFQFQFALQLGVRDTPGRQQSGARWVHYYWAQSPELFADMGQFGEMNLDFWVQYAYRYLRSVAVPEEIATYSARQLSQEMQDRTEPENYVYPCVPETLQAIKDAGYTLGLVSNRSNSCQAECERLGLWDYFDFAYVAAEVEVWKPDPRIFERAFTMSGSHPQRTVYIGDNYYADVLGAKNAGMQPILLDSEGVFLDPTFHQDCTVIHSLRELGPLLI